MNLVFMYGNVTNRQLTIISILAIGYFVTKVGKFPKTQEKRVPGGFESKSEEKTPDAANRLG